MVWNSFKFFSTLSIKSAPISDISRLKSDLLTSFEIGIDSWANTRPISNLKIDFWHLLLRNKEVWLVYLWGFISMMEIPVCESPCIIACAIGEAPLHRGNKLAWTFNTPLKIITSNHLCQSLNYTTFYFGKSSMTLFGKSFPKEETTPMSNWPLTMESGG